MDRHERAARRAGMRRPVVCCGGPRCDSPGDGVVDLTDLHLERKAHSG